MKKLLVLIGTISLAAAIATTPVKAQEWTMDDVSQECSTILLQEHCDRLVKLGRRSIGAFARALMILLEDGLNEANHEMGRMLDNLEKGIPIQPIPPKKRGFEI